MFKQISVSTLKGTVCKIAQLDVSRSEIAVIWIQFFFYLFQFKHLAITLTTVAPLGQTHFS